MPFSRLLCLACVVPLIAAAVASEAPVAQDSTITTIETNTKAFTLYGSDADTDRTQLRWVIDTHPAHGVISYTYPPEEYDWDAQPDYSRYLRYTAEAGFLGSDSLTYHITDGENTSNTATVSITVNENTPPIVASGWTRALADRTTQLPQLVNDADSFQPESIEVIAAPSHGSIGAYSSYHARIAYTPDPGFTGDDSFTYTYSDGIVTTEPVTCHIRVAAAGDPAAMTIKIIVKPWLYAELQSEIDRLATTLIAEGYTPDIVQWEGTSGRGLWEHLRAAWQDNDTRLHGAILLGDVPVAEESDRTYWDMVDYDPQTPGFHIWVTRIYAQSDTEYGHEVPRLRRALDANWRYRTGQSRLPQTASMCNMYNWYDDLAVYGRVWDHAEPVAERDVVDAMRYGDEIMHRSEHNSPVSSSWLFTNCDQLRFAFISGCTAGGLGKAVSQYQQTYGGGNLMSIGSKNNTFWGDFRIGFYLDDYSDEGVARLNAGEPLGSVMLALANDYWLPEGTFAYGDLSIPVKATPHNDVPTLDSLSASTDNPTAGEAVTFTASASDVDVGTSDSPHVSWEYQGEWWFRGTGHHQIDPTVVETSNATSASFSQTQVYDVPHVYTVRLEVVDEWLGRAWREQTITVAPDSTRPLRINCGAANAYAQYCPLGDWTAGDGTLWLHEQGHRSGTWGYSGDDGGRPSNNRNPSNDPVAATDDDTLYQYWRNVRKTDKDQMWRVPLVDGSYTVRLHFADMRSGASGERLLDAWIEGAQVLDGYDAYQIGGAKTAVIEEFPVTIADGELTIALRRDADATADAFISAIEILPPVNHQRAIVMDRLPDHVWTIAPADGSEDEEENVHTFEGLDPDATYRLTPQAGNNG